MCDGLISGVSHLAIYLSKSSSLFYSSSSTIAPPLCFFNATLFGLYNCVSCFIIIITIFSQLTSSRALCISFKATYRLKSGKKD